MTAKKATKKIKKPKTLAEYLVDVQKLDHDDLEDRKKVVGQCGPAEDCLDGATLFMPPCGCTVEGRGTMPFPVRIIFCETHRGEGPLGELLERMHSVHPEDLPASIRDLRSEWLKAGCPGLKHS